MEIKIKEIRTRIGISQTDLARKLGVSKACLSRWENQKNNLPTVRTLQKIADALQIKIKDLIEE